MKCESSDDLRSLALENCDVLLQSGYTKPIALFSIGEKTDIIHTITLHEVLLQSLGEAQQFKEGIGAFNVSQMLHTHGNELRPFFVMIHP